MEGRPLEEPEGSLIERARHGDADAYGELVRRFQTLAFRTAYLVLDDAGEAEDAAQEGLMRAYRALGRFRAGTAFRPWLLAIVANAARNRRRSSQRREQLALRAAADPASGGAAPSPEAGALAHEQRTAVLQAVNGLRKQDRQAITGRYFLELSEAEMADFLGVPKGTVKSRLSRALGRLRVVLGASFAESREVVEVSRG